MTEVDRKIAIETEAAKRLLSNLAAQGASDDAELVADTIEGETGLTEAIEAAISEIDEGEIQIIGLKAKEGEFADRRRRIEERNDRIRASIEQAMIATGQNALKLPSVTLTLAKRAPGPIVQSEADIPTKFWIEQERPAPKLDRKALLAALNKKEAVPGATLDNGSISLTLRRK